MPFKATVELLLDVSSEAEACDAVAEMLREHSRPFAPSSVLVDWRHQCFRHSADCGPVEVGAIPPGFNEDMNWPEDV